MSEKNATVQIPVDEKTVIIEKKYTKTTKNSDPVEIGDRCWDDNGNQFLKVKEIIENGSFLITTHIDNIEKAIKALE